MAGIVKTAKDFALPAVAITDHGTLHCVPEFYDEAKKAEIKPIIGCEVYIAPDHNEVDRYFHLVLLAQNRQGYKNLCRLITMANTAKLPNGNEAFYYKPRISFDWLETYGEGLIVTSACVSSELSWYGIEAHTMLESPTSTAFEKEVALKKYLDVMSRFKGLFKEKYFVEIMHDDMGGDIGIKQRMANDMARKWAHTAGVKLVGTCDSHYLLPADKRDHQTLLDLNTKQLFYAPEESKRMVYKGNFHYKSPDEYIAEFGVQIAKNTAEIAAMVEHYSPYEDKFVLPAVRVPGTDRKTIDATEIYGILEQKGRTGFIKAMMEGRLVYATIEEYETRLDYELSVFKKMEMSAYPAALLEIVDFAKSAGIPVGPGRGSVSGSLLCYLVGLTQVDPLRFGLLFERFLNPERVSMPDIDTDFGIFGRPRVIQFIRENWGEEYVSLICTFNTYGLRKAIQDLCSIMEIPHSTAMAITKTISEDDIEATWDSALEDYPEFKKETTKLPPSVLVDLERSVKAMYGKPSNLGVHAAGVLISSKPIYEVAPLAKAKDGVAVQYQFDYCERFGLLKMDILGNRNLDVIYDTCKKVGIADQINIPLDDKASYELICRGRLAGMFQIEKSKQFKEVCIKLQPSQFDEIVDLVALYRPGPIENGDLNRYVKRKFDPEYELNETIADPTFRKILDKTRSCLIYQEQIMEVAKQLAGYSMSKADDLRKAIGKKDKEKMATHETPILAGLKEKSNFSEADAKTIWELIVTSGRYSWNKAHAVAYGYITYWTAYLSANYPGQFFASYCNMDIDQDKQRIYISEAKSRGCGVSVPNINKSIIGYTFSDNMIYYGVQAVRGIGENTAKLIVQDRDQHGPYLSVSDFRNRIPAKACNSSMLMSLVAAGAFDSVHGGRLGRRHLYEMVENKDYPSTTFKIGIPSDEGWLIEMEGKALGLSVSVNPLEQYSDEIKAERAQTVSQTLMDADHADMVGADLGTTRIAGVITSLRKTVTKKQKRQMAFGTLMDNEGDIVDVVFFPDAYEPVAHWLKVNKAVIVSGELEDKQGQGAGTANLKAQVVIQLGMRKPYCVAFTVADVFQASWFGEQSLEQKEGLVQARATFASNELIDMVPEGQRYVPIMKDYPNFGPNEVQLIF